MREKEMTRLTIIMGVVFAVFIAGCGGNGEEAAEVRTIKVRAVEITDEDVTIPVRTSGVLSSSSEQRLSFKTGGIIESIQVDEGDVVKKGDVLASLDLAEITAMYIQAESGWKKSQRDLKRMKNLYGDSVVTLEQY